ncbi:MAG TPA: hypothetical protein VGC87_16340 [Pyrinomonadaceae bacterium]|jgi:hypothetical protein
MTNREQLADAQLLKKDVQLNPEQEKAIEELTAEEVAILMSIKNKTADRFPPESLVSPIAHHH